MHFSDILLELVENRLNMMMTEIFQLKGKIDFSDHHKLVMIILKEISNGHIKSDHINEQEAKNILLMYEAFCGDNTHVHFRKLKQKDFEYDYCEFRHYH